jgi:hypothetical protein
MNPSRRLRGPPRVRGRPRGGSVWSAAGVRRLKASRNRSRSGAPHPARE